MDSNQLQNIISDITKNIIEQSEASCVTASTTRPETLVFLTCAIASPQKTFSLIAEKYGPDTEYVVFDERLSYGGIREVRANGANLSELLEKTAAAVNVVLLAPKSITAMLRSMPPSGIWCVSRRQAFSRANASTSTRSR